MQDTTEVNNLEYINPKLAAIYNNLNQHYPLEKQFYFDFASQINAKKIIDIGCGTGLLTLELAKLGYELIGVEPAKAMLDVAKADAFSDKVKWIHGDALALEESMADMTIMSTHVFQCFLEDDYLQRVLRSINSSLKTGGYLVFDSRNSHTPIQDFGWPSKTNPNKFINNQGEEMSCWVDVLDHKDNQLTYEMNYFNHKTEEKLISINELIFRSQKEITEYLDQAGFEVEEVFGDWDKSQISKTSLEFIFVARKR